MFARPPKSKNNQPTMKHPVPTPDTVHRSCLRLPASAIAAVLMLLALTSLHAQTNPPFADGTLFIEMEDYNYNGGQFISDATDGMAGPYNGWAYQNFAGIPGIDFNVPNLAGTDDQSGYRPADY